MADGDVLGDVAAHRAATDDRRLVHVKRVEDRHRIVGQLLDACRATGRAATAEATLVGHDQPEVLGQRFLRGPHAVVERKGVQEEHRAATATGVNRDADVGQCKMMGVHGEIIRS